MDENTLIILGLQQMLKEEQEEVDELRGTLEHVKMIENALHPTHQTQP